MSEVRKALELLANKIGTYGSRIDKPITIEFGNGLTIRESGVMVSGGLPSVAEWIECNCNAVCQNCNGSKERCNACRGVFEDETVVADSKKCSGCGQNWYTCLCTHDDDDGC